MSLVTKTPLGILNVDTGPCLWRFWILGPRRVTNSYPLPTVARFNWSIMKAFTLTPEGQLWKLLGLPPVHSESSTYHKVWWGCLLQNLRKTPIRRGQLSESTCPGGLWDQPVCAHPELLQDAVPSVLQGHLFMSYSCELTWPHVHRELVGWVHQTLSILVLGQGTLRSRQLTSL